MSRAVLTGVAAGAIIAAVGGAFIADHVRRVGLVHFTTSAAAESAAAPIYYRDPDDKPFYSLTPKKTADGRAYRAVPSGADLSFDNPVHEEIGTKVADTKKSEAKRS